MGPRGWPETPVTASLRCVNFPEKRRFRVFLLFILWAIVVTFVALKGNHPLKDAEENAHIWIARHKQQKYGRSYVKWCFVICRLFRLTQQPYSGLGRLIVEVSRSHADTPHSVGLLWTRDRPIAETYTWQRTIFTRDRCPCARWDSNPQSFQAIGRRPAP